MDGGWLEDTTGLCRTGSSAAVIVVVVVGRREGGVPFAFQSLLVMGLHPDFICRLPQVSLYSASRENACPSIGAPSNPLLLLSRALGHPRRFVVLRCVSKIHQNPITGGMTEKSSKGPRRSETRL